MFDCYTLVIFLYSCYTLDLLQALKGKFLAMGEKWAQPLYSDLFSPGFKGRTFDRPRFSASFLDLHFWTRSSVCWFMCTVCTKTCCACKNKNVYVFLFFVFNVHLLIMGRTGKELNWSEQLPLFSAVLKWYAL